MQSLMEKPGYKYKDWKRYIRNVVRHFVIKHKGMILATRIYDEHDLRTFAYFAFIEASEQYKKSKKVPFKYFLAQRINWRILDEIRKVSWVPRSKFKTNDIKMFSIDVLRAKYNSVGDNEYSLLLDIEDRKQNKIDKTMIQDSIDYCLKNVSEKKKQVMFKFYVENKTLTQVGKEMEIHMSRVGQILSEVLVEAQNKIIKEKQAWLK